MKPFWPLLLLTLFTACTERRKTSPADSPATSPDTPQLVRQTPVAASQIYRGLVVIGNEVNTFRDCTSGKTYWFADETQSLHSIYDSVVQPVRYPYEAVYAVVQGTLGQRETVGYASEYEGTLRISRVDTLQGKNRFMPCFSYEFWLSGTEPFWSLQISEAENGIFFEDIGRDQYGVFPYVKPTVKGNTWTYNARNVAGQMLRIVLKKETCSDGMSDLVYNYSADVRFNNATFHGCAVRYGEPQPRE